MEKIILKSIIGIVITGISIIVFLNFYKLKNSVKVHFLSLENADSCIIQYKNNVIVIDTGEKKDKDKLKQTLTKFNIKQIDYLILTHPDKDHIGNAKYLINNYKVKEIFQTDYNKNSDIQNELENTIKEKNIQNYIVKEISNIEIEGLKLKIYPPEKTYNDSNNNSLITIIEFNNKKALFTGDIQTERIRDILESLYHVDLLKVPYHGRKNDLVEELIEKTTPEMAVITGTEPDELILKKLEKFKSKIKLTHKQNVEITFYVN